MHCQAEEEEIRKAAAKGIIINHTDSLFIPLNNRLPDDDDEDDGEGGGAFVAGTGLDSALDVLSLAVKGPGKTDEHPERRQKVRKKSIHSCLQTAVDNHSPPSHYVWMTKMITAAVQHLYVITHTHTRLLDANVCVLDTAIMFLYGALR